MALGDIPAIPREYIPRMQRLIEKMRKKEISPDEVKSNFLGVMGRMKIDSSGIQIKGNFGQMVLESKSLNALVESFKKMLDILPMFKGKEFLIKKGDEITRIKLGLIIKKTPATKSDLDDPTLPVVEFVGSDSKDAAFERLMDNLAYKFQGIEGTLDKPPGLYKIHRIEEFAGWAGSWEDCARLLGVTIPSVSLTTKSVLDKLGESVPKFWDNALKKCGV